MFDTDISFDGLLETQETLPDNGLMASCVEGQVVMVTGAGGTVGSSLSLQLAQLNPSIIILLDRSAQALARIERLVRCQLDARHTANRIKLVPIHGTVSNCQQTETVFRYYSVNIVFHAAADKQVGMLEHHVVAGLQNNTFAAFSLAKTAVKAGVRDFILISTNKAGNPVNVMGASKRLAEHLLQSLTEENTGTRFSIVRFGNVMGSSDSVLPLFRQQILFGGPVTVTHPLISRSFIKSTSAAKLIIQAGAIARGGEVFSLDMPGSVRITELAKRLIEHMGYVLCSESDSNNCCCKTAIHIHYTGLREGESLTDDKPANIIKMATSHPHISRLVEPCLSTSTLTAIMKQLQHACTLMDNDLARALLIQAVTSLGENDLVNTSQYLNPLSARSSHQDTWKYAAALNS